VKWFFLASFLAGLLLCCFAIGIIALALVTRVPSEWWKVVVFSVPCLIMFAWMTREMFRAFRRAAGKREPRQS
jgi:hypothetical protein